MSQITFTPSLGENEAVFGRQNKAHATESNCDDDSGDDNDIGHAYTGALKPRFCGCLFIPLEYLE